MAKGSKPYTFEDWLRGVAPPKGWDGADAVEDGWTREQLDRYINRDRYPDKAEQLAVLFPEEERPAMEETPPPPDEPPPSDPSGDIMFDPEEQWDIGLDFALTSKGDRDRKSTANLILVTRHHPALRGVFGFDQFKRSVMVMRRPPWSTPVKTFPAPYSKVTDAPGLCAFIELRAQLRPTIEACHAQAIKLAMENRVDSLHMMLARLPAWDGTPRIDTWLVDHLGADDTPYTRAVGSKTLIAAMARASWSEGDPLVKVDGTLVLEGAQGIGKTKAIAALSIDPRKFYYSMATDFSSKDAAISVGSAWIVELAELASLGRSTVGAMKKFLTETHDNYRPPYETENKDVVRRCIFIGTVNPGHSGRYLSDETGNRRFLPVRVSKRLDDAAFAAVRDQLWAEALARYRAGESWWVGEDIEAIVQKEQDDRTELSPMAVDLQEVLASETRDALTIEDALTLLGVRGAKDRADRGLRLSVGRAMVELGWRPKQETIKSGVRTTVYRRKSK